MNIVRQNSDYALRMMVNLARNFDGDAVSARKLAEQEDVSYQFACKIMQKLDNAGLVVSKMGKKGGYRLSRKPDAISLADVLVAVQGPVFLNHCSAGSDGCDRKGNCPISAKLDDLQGYIQKYLAGITLDEIATDAAA